MLQDSPWAAFVLLAVFSPFGAGQARGQAAAGNASATPAEAVFARIHHDRDRLNSFLRVLPKGGVLHAHLSGELDPDVLINLAVQEGYFLRQGNEDLGKIGVDRDVRFKFVSPAAHERVPQDRRDRLAPVGDWLERAPGNRALLRDALTLQPGEALEEFFGPIFDRIDELGKDRRLQHALFQGVIEKAHAEGISYLELRINPRLAVDRQLIEKYAYITRECNARWPAEEAVEARFVVGVHRGTPKTPDDLRTAFQVAAADDGGTDLIVGVDLVGLENAAGAPAQYLGVLKDLRRSYPAVHITLHAGESTEASSHVRDSILLGAERIGHATNLHLDPNDTMRLARDNGVLVEVSLVSSSRIFHLPIEQHPFRAYLKAGIPLSLNTDDGAIFGSTQTDEFTEAVLAFGLTWSQLKALAENSLRYSFAPGELKGAMLARWQARWARFEQNPPDR
jgi:adenosine deaminase CECR1